MLKTYKVLGVLVLNTENTEIHVRDRFSFKTTSLLNDDGRERTTIEPIEIPEMIEDNGRYTFNQCDKMVFISIPMSNTLIDLNADFNEKLCIIFFKEYDTVDEAKGFSEGFMIGTKVCGQICAQIKY